MMTAAMLGVLGIALVWSLYPALYVAAAQDGDALLACGWLLAFDLGKLALSGGLAGLARGGGPVGTAGWQRSPWFWLSVWHGTVNLWFAVSAAYAGAGAAVLILECWPLPAGLVVVWGRQGLPGLRAALSLALAVGSLLCVMGVFLVVEGGGRSIVDGAGGWARFAGLAAALLGMCAAASRSGAVMFAGSGDAGGWRLGRADAWHICAYFCSVVLALLAGVASFGLGGVGTGWLALVFCYGVATMGGHRFLNWLLSARHELVLHLPIYAPPFAGVGWLWLLGLERPAQPLVFLLGGCLILAGNLLALRRL